MAVLVLEEGWGGSRGRGDGEVERVRGLVCDERGGGSLRRGGAGGLEVQAGDKLGGLLVVGVLQVLLQQEALQLVLALLHDGHVLLHQHLLRLQEQEPANTHTHTHTHTHVHTHAHAHRTHPLTIVNLKRYVRMYTYCTL